MLLPDWGSTGITVSVNPLAMVARRDKWEILETDGPLTRARKRRRLTLQELGDRIGTSATQISRLEKSIRRVTWDWATKIADALDYDPAELMFGGKPPMVPVIGRVDSAGALIPLANDAAQHEAPCPRGMNPGTAAAVVLETDAGPLMGRGWMLFLDHKAAANADQAVGALCLVKMRAGATLLRQVRRGPTRGRYNLIAVDGRFTEDADLEWAARIRAIVAGDLAEAA